MQIAEILAFNRRPAHAIRLHEELRGRDRPRGSQPSVPVCADAPRLVREGWRRRRLGRRCRLVGRMALRRARARAPLARLDNGDRDVRRHVPCSILDSRRGITEGSEAHAGMRPCRDRSSGRRPSRRFDCAIVTGNTLPGGLLPFSVARYDEVVIWLPEQAALLSGDVLVRNDDGGLRLCPDSWLAPGDGPMRVGAALRTLPPLPIEYVLDSHGPLALAGSICFANAMRGTARQPFVAEISSLLPSGTAGSCPWHMAASG